MERDTTIAPPAEQTPTDTFIQQQGQGQPQDTAGYTGMERVDTTGQADTTGYGRDTSGMGVPDTTGAVPDTGMTGLDTTQTGQPADTTGYNPSQDTTTAR
jgi:hypothetical protein